MQVPEHIISLYVATCGQSGPALGSDEKEIILLVYAVIDIATAEIIGTKQFLVQPDGNLVRAINSSETSMVNNSTQQQQTLKYGITCNNITLNNNNNNNSNANNNNTNNCTTLATIQQVNNCLNTGNIFKEQNNNNITIENGSAVVNTTVVGTTDEPTPTIIELPPIAMAQATGIPLHESLKEFDEYMRSLSLNENDIILITDGQLPLRQCLHREACVKDIDLPHYYNKFCDLRKEFVRYKNGDLSCALVPVKDIKKILQMPTLPTPESIAEMMTDLCLTTTQDNTFYMRESRDMITVIQTMLKNGHKFIANEVVNLILEPGICSIDDEIDGDCIVRARGLPWQSSDQDIAKFFRGLNVANGGVALCLSPLGRRNGEALVRFISQEHRDMALKRHKHHIGNRYIEVYRATGEDFLAVAGGASNEAQSFLSKGAQVIIRMRGLPYDCTAKQVLDFFTAGDSPCEVHDGAEGVLFVKKPDGRATGDAFVLFSKELDAPKALSRHRECIGQRYIELFRSTTAEVQQVLNRSMDSKTFEANITITNNNNLSNNNNNMNNNNNNPSTINHNAPALIAQLPSVQLSLLPQHLITSGTTKNCIRLRGLPYEAQVEHILHFLDDFAKHIIYQGVHMVINAQGQPSGEAFIQMESEDAARLCAQRKHNQFMVFGKKYRYIEVFQCSGDDMNMVLNGGLQSPLATHAPPPPHAALAQQKAVVAAAAAAAAAASLVSPGQGASYMGGSFATPFGHFDPSATALLQASYHGQHTTPLGTTYYAPPFFYWPYSSPPLSPTTCYNHQAAAAAAANAVQSPHQLAAAYHQTMYSLDLISAQINFASQTGGVVSPPPPAGSLQLQITTPPPVPPLTPQDAHATEKQTTPTAVPSACQQQQQPKAKQIMTLLQFKQFSTPTVTPIPVTEAAKVIPTISATSPTIASSSSSNNKSEEEVVQVVETLGACDQIEHQQPQSHQKDKLYSTNITSVEHQQQGKNLSNITNSNNNKNTNIHSASGSNILLESSEGRCKDMPSSDMLTVDTLDAHALDSNSNSNSTTTTTTSTAGASPSYSLAASHKQHITPITGRAKHKVNKVC